MFFYSDVITFFILFVKLCHLIRSGLNESFIPSQQVPYLVQGDEWIGYDNQRSIMNKVRVI